MDYSVTLCVSVALFLEKICSSILYHFFLFWEAFCFFWVFSGFVFKFKSIEFIHLEFRLQPENFVSYSVLARSVTEG